MADEPRETDLDQSVCLALLRSKHVGRLVVSDVDPVVVPVNFTLQDATIVVRTDAGARAARHVGATAVFEVDEVDELRHVGWSVIARGVLEEASRPVPDEAELREQLQPWAGGAKDCWLRLRIDEVTGRFVRGPDPRPALDHRGYL